MYQHIHFVFERVFDKLNCRLEIGGEECILVTHQSNVTVYIVKILHLLLQFRFFLLLLGHDCKHSCYFVLGYFLSSQCRGSPEVEILALSDFLYRLIQGLQRILIIKDKITRIDTFLLYCGDCFIFLLDLHIKKYKQSVGQKSDVTSWIFPILLHKSRLHKRLLIIIQNPMKYCILLILCLLNLAFCTVVPRVGPIDSHVPLTYKVNVDDPPLVRWAPIIKDYQHQLTRMIEFFNILIIPKTFFDGVQWFAKNEFKHKDFVDEVDAIAQLSGLPFDKLFFLNFMYEYSTFKACSSILVRNDKGKVVHGRNMDFQMWQLVSKLMVNIEYYKNGKRIFSIDSIVGMAFALTGIRHGAFAITEDTRFTRQITEDLISVMVDNHIPSAWLLRKVLAEETTYQSAVQRLKTEEIGAPIYYIISGIGKGVVIQREIKGVHAYYELSEDNWFVVQTNYDRDQPEPIYDPRRVPVQKRMRQRGNTNFTEKTMFNEYMSAWPTFNIASILSVVFVVEEDYYNTTIWYGTNPTPSSNDKLY